MRQADLRRRLGATITTKRHLQMAPRTTQIIPPSPPPRSLRPARIPARNPRARRHHTRGVGGGKRDGASGGANGGANDEASGGGRTA